MKIVIVGAFASYATILLLPLTERTGIVPPHTKVPTKELLDNIDQIIRLMAKFEPVRDPASVGDPIHR